jgi:drug/metabolite transporter (DMT)-like permease
MKTLFNWIGRALSEGGTPSSKRLFAFMFVLTVCYAILYKVHMSHDLPTYLYYPALGMIALLAGVATIAQLMSIARGTPSPKDEPKQDNNA